jgi:hypothetical protein
MDFHPLSIFSYALARARLTGHSVAGGGDAPRRFT